MATPDSARPNERQNQRAGLERGEVPDARTPATYPHHRRRTMTMTSSVIHTCTPIMGENVRQIERRVRGLRRPVQVRLRIRNGSERVDRLMREDLLAI